MPYTILRQTTMAESTRWRNPIGGNLSAWSFLAERMRCFLWSRTRGEKTGQAGNPGKSPSQKPCATNDHSLRVETFFLPTFIVQSKTTCILLGGPNSSPGFATYWPCDWQFVSLLWASVSTFVYLAEISFVMETTAFRIQGLHLTASLIL